MATISGSVFFNQTNSTPLSGIKCPNIPIGLYNNLGIGLIILTNASGDFSFINVPNGTYTLVEAGTSTATSTSPGDFATATSIGVILASDPPISSMPSPPVGATHTQSFSPNTIYITITGSNVSGRNFYDAPVRDIAINKSGLILGPNLVNTAGNGTIGTLPAGTSPNTQPATAPYSNVCTGFTFIQQTSSSPNDGFYSVNNITNTTTFGWLNSADHTARDETGRQLVINGANPGGLIFTETIANLTPNSLYYASIWIMNLLNQAQPQLGVRVKALNGSTIFNLALSNIAYFSYPTWQETATPINIGNNTDIIYEIYSNGPAAGGNDYTVDDISFQSISINGGLELIKSVDKSTTFLGDILLYTISLTNSSAYTITNVTFLDFTPDNTVFIPGSVTINSITLPAANPNTTIPLANIPPSDISTITFNVAITTLPNDITIYNYATSTYSLAPIPGGASVNATSTSNIVTTTVINPKVLFVKNVDLEYATLGNILTYLISIQNIGNIYLENLSFLDTIPSGTEFKPDSLFVNGINLLGIDLNTFITLPNLNINEINTISFQVTIIP